MKNQTDIFISYRRDGGDMTAMYIFQALKDRGYGDEEVNEFMEILLDLDLHPTQSEREYYERLIGGIILAAGTMDLDVIRDKFGNLGEGDAA